ncbi:MAG: ATP-dependent nuclease, partial [Flavobacteriaceae bacterium]
SVLSPAGIQTDWKCSNLHDGSNTSSPLLLRALRQLIPVVWLKRAALLGYNPNEQNLDISSEPAEDRITQLKQQICFHAAEVIQGRTTNQIASVDDGFEAVKSLAAELKRDATNPSTSKVLNLKLREILNMVSVQETESMTEALKRFHGFTGKLGALVLINALIINSPRNIEEYSFPLLIIEAPEAYLHPRTLATIGILLKSFKWQKIVTTNSGLLLGEVPFDTIRRIRRKDDKIIVNRINTANYSNEDLRRISYHLGAHHNMAPFSRFWILVEGESEYWIIPHLAKIMNYEFLQEGISVIDFAQAGLKPLLKIAEDLDIGWQVLLDGDKAGIQYEKTIKAFSKNNNLENNITRLTENDIEHFFWEHGFDYVYTKWARLGNIPNDELKPKRTINRAVKNRSKPFLALSIIEAISKKGVRSIPVTLFNMIEHCVAMARKN